MTDLRFAHGCHPNLQMPCTYHAVLCITSTGTIFFLSNPCFQTLFSSMMSALQKISPNFQGSKLASPSRSRKKAPPERVMGGIPLKNLETIARTEKCSDFLKDLFYFDTFGFHDVPCAGSRLHACLTEIGCRFE